MYYRNHSFEWMSCLQGVPSAVATVRGSEEYRSIYGEIRFYPNDKGVFVYAHIHGLPVSDAPCGNDFFAFHIHGGATCTGNSEDPFADAGTHFNPTDCPHPYHAGDMPPLFSANGEAILIFLTDRFTVSQIIGKTVIIHASPDDFMTQPSGNAGHKIACGVIMNVRR